ncbi:MAG: DNA-binding response regulator [Mucilaginibacter sp.]|nr:DNA-binding response regulator [Mucilaginibacter sp.]
MDVKPIVLVVDDNEEILDFVCDDLATDYIVYTAANGQDALNILEKDPVQLVISDIMMPVMDGFELCRQIKSNIQFSHIPVIMLTAKHTFQSKIEGLEIGADAYIEKPFSPRHLRVQIANLLQNRSKIKDYFANSPLVHINTISHSKADEHFLEKLHEEIYKHINDVTLDVEQLAEIMNMSRPTLYRKIKGISDLTPNDLINIARLKKAAELLAEGNHKIFEISELVGYTSQTNFGRNFLKQFGMSPTDFVNSKRTARSDKSV